MKNSEFFFNDDDEDKNPYGEAFLKEDEPVDPFALIREHVENSRVIEAAEILNEAYTSHLSTYHDDPIMCGLVHVISRVEVTFEENLTCEMRSNSKTLLIPHRVAHEMRNVNDIMFYVIFERCRMIVDRTQHVLVNSLGMDLNNGRDIAIWHLAVGMWGSALTRCYIASIMPERIYLHSKSPLDLLYHGFNPEMTVEGLKQAGLAKTSDCYKSLYELSGQEPFHIELGRLAPSNSQYVEFEEALRALWEDLKEDGNKDNEIEDQQPFTSSDDEHIVKNSKNLQKSKSGFVDNIPLPDIEADTALGEYLSKVVAADSRHIGSNNTTATLKPGGLRNALQFTNHAGIVESMNHASPTLTLASVPGPKLSLDDYNRVAQGYTPSMFEVEVEPEFRQRVYYDVYYDVSASMIIWWGFVRSLLRVMNPLLNKSGIHVFSTVVENVKMDLLNFGTTHGTDINIALKHAAKRGVKNVILITDLEDSDVEECHFDHLIVVSTFRNKNSRHYRKLIRSGSPNKLDSCLNKVTGKIEFHLLFADELMSNLQ